MTNALLLAAAREALARCALGNLETQGKNRGPVVDDYARGVGLDPERGAYAWCTSGLYDVFRVAATALGVRNPFPRTAKAVRVFELLAGTCLSSNPAPGFVYVLDHGQPGSILAEWQSGSYTDDGHVGIVVATNDGPAPVEVELPDVVAALLGVPAPGRRYELAPGDMLEVSGNTFASRGSREGNRWACHRGTPEVTHGGVLLGYLDLGRIAERVA